MLICIPRIAIQGIFAPWINKLVRSEQCTLMLTRKSIRNSMKMQHSHFNKYVCTEASCRCINFIVKERELHFPDQGYIICVYYILDWANLIYNGKAFISLVSIMKVTALYHLHLTFPVTHTHTAYQMAKLCCFRLRR